jgi:hypothetical protein
MRKTFQSGSFILFLSAALFFVVSCSKENSSSGISNTPETPTTSATSATIAVGSGGGDSIYILQQCSPGFFRDTIAEASLPESVLSFLNTNYTGFNFQKSFKIKDSAGTIGGYVVIITFNGKPVGLLFDSSGNFQKVLEQREHGDLEGNGWHQGGRFDDRDGKHRDTIALASLPSAISSYMSANYPSDTLIRAYQNKDSSILVISKNDGFFANLFSSAGEFVKRITLTPPSFLLNPPVLVSITQDSLPASDQVYLSTTYPNYVFESGVSVSENNQLKGYMVVIDANNTKYAIWFDADGNVIATLTIW